MKPRNIQFSAPVNLFSYGTQNGWSAELHTDVKPNINLANRLVEFTNNDGQVHLVFFESISGIRLAAAEPVKEEQKKGGK